MIFFKKENSETASPSFSTSPPRSLLYLTTRKRIETLKKPSPRTYIPSSRRAPFLSSLFLFILKKRENSELEFLTKPENLFRKNEASPASRREGVLTTTHATDGDDDSNPFLQVPLRLSNEQKGTFSRKEVGTKSGRILLRANKQGICRGGTL